MPSAEIHTLSVTNCSPAVPVLNRATNEIAMPSVIRLHTTAARPASLAGSSVASSESASGTQRRMESVIGSLGRRDQEVESHGGNPDNDGRGVVAQEPGLGAADRGRAGPDDAGGASGDAATDETLLQDGAAEAPQPQRRTHDEEVDQLVEVPLVVQERVHRAEAGLQHRRAARLGDVEPVGGADAGDGDERADDQADPVAADARRQVVQTRSGERGAQEAGHRIVDAGDLEKDD